MNKVGMMDLFFLQIICFMFYCNNIGDSFNKYLKAFL